MAHWFSTFNIEEIFLGICVVKWKTMTELKYQHQNKDFSTPLRLSTVCNYKECALPEMLQN